MKKLILTKSFHDPVSPSEDGTPIAITRYYQRGKIKGCDFDELKSDLPPRTEFLTGHNKGALIGICLNNTFEEK
jgi:hypothetical protein